MWRRLAKEEDSIGAKFVEGGFGNVRGVQRQPEGEDYPLPFIKQLQAAVTEEAEAGDVGQSDGFQGWMWELHLEEDWAIDEDKEATELGSKAGEGGERDSERDGEEDSREDSEGEDGEEGGNSEDSSTGQERRIMGRETERRIGVKIRVALWRQAYLAIQRELCRNAEIRQAVDEIYEGQPRAGYSRYMEEMIYGLLINESPFTTASEKEQFQAVSNDWHQLLQFDLAFDKNRVEPGVKRRIAAEQEAAELRHSTDAGFRGIQEAALQAIIHSDEAFVLAIMLTGGSKSLLFMLLAVASQDGITIVIVLMVALRQDMCKRSNEKGILCAEWDTTLPLSEEAAFHEAVGVLEREMFTIQDRTVQPNIAYAVVGYERKEEDEAVR
ncbi:hypothetical protein Q7P35_000001 [Cladosporium inversicolor]